MSNDDSSIGFTLRRPSRAERAIDDPIREMEGMLVDEYGRFVFHFTLSFPPYIIIIFCMLYDIFILIFILTQNYVPEHQIFMLYWV